MPKQLPEDLRFKIYKEMTSNLELKGAICHFKHEEVIATSDSSTWMESEMRSLGNSDVWDTVSLRKALGANEYTKSKQELGTLSSGIIWS